MSLHWFLLALESHDLSQVWLNVFRDQQSAFFIFGAENEEGALLVPKYVQLDLT